MHLRTLKGRRRWLTVGALFATGLVALRPPWKGRVDLGPIQLDFAGPHRWLFAPPKVPVLPAKPSTSEADDLIQRTNALYGHEQSAVQPLPTEFLTELEKLDIPEIARTREVASAVAFRVDYSRLFLYIVAIVALSSAVEAILNRRNISTEEKRRAGAA